MPKCVVCVCRVSMLGIVLVFLGKYLNLGTWTLGVMKFIYFILGGLCDVVSACK